MKAERVASLTKTGTLDSYHQRLPNVHYVVARTELSKHLQSRLVCHQQHSLHAGHAHNNLVFCRRHIQIAVVGMKKRARWTAPAAYSAL